MYRLILRLLPQPGCAMLYTLPCMHRSWRLWAAAVLSAALLELPFPLAGPLPAWRTVFAWFGLVPLLCAVLSAAVAGRPHSLRRSFLLGYLCGFLWYMGNCYWVRNTMMRYGDMPLFAPTLLLIGFSLVLGLYCGFFGLGIQLLRQASGSTRLALVFAPVLWTALDLAAARITSVPWDQLGYSQVDNALVTQIAPWTGVYGISFVLVAVNALIAGGLLLECCRGKHCPGNWLANRRVWGVSGAILLMVCGAGVTIAPPRPAPTATAVLIQPNLNVGDDNPWIGAVWGRHIAQFVNLAGEMCKGYIAGIPQTGAPRRQIPCPENPAPPALVVWPESPAPFFQDDPRFQQAMRWIAQAIQAPLVVGGIGTDLSPQNETWSEYNSAMIFNSKGKMVGRYDKIHLVPFGEYVPFAKLLSFAHKLTGRVGKFDRGTLRNAFLVDGRRYGIFICYEDVFGAEVRQFARNGAEVFVNISDDGWYGDTSAPWQHLNMARMRAIENRRWLLRDTNNGVTAVIDPYGRVRESIPRHKVDALPAEFAYSDKMTFYTEHGDVFAWLCALLSLGTAGWAGSKLLAG